MAAGVEHIWALATLEYQEIPPVCKRGPVASEVQQQVLARRLLQLVMAHAHRDITRLLARSDLPAEPCASIW